MYTIARKEEIINMLELEGEVDVNTLSAHFAISKETVRRDLRELEKQGVLTRTHGGGVYNREQHNKQAEYPIAIRGIQRFNEKNEICRYAASLIEDGDTVFMDNSSTTMYLIQYIPQSLRVTVVTNSMKLLLEAVRIANVNLQYVCFGGTFKESNLSFYGNTTLKNAQAYYPNKAFMSCAGIREDGLVTDASMQEVDTKQLMLKQCKAIYYLADYTKFSSSGQVYLSNLTSGDALITDHKATTQQIAPIRSLGVQVTVV